MRGRDYIGCPAWDTIHENHSPNRAEFRAMPQGSWVGATMRRAEGALGSVVFRAAHGKG